MADIQVCPFHLKGHCKNKTKCTLSHAISDCNMGSLCKDKKSCKFCHVRVCSLHPKCHFKKCCYQHPLIPAPTLPYPLPYHPLHPHPRILPLLPYPRRIQTLESQVHKLSREVLVISNKLATGVYGSTNKTELIEKPDLEVGEGCLNVTKDIRQEPDLEIVPTNQQDEVNIENCLKVTNKNTKWWPWLR